METVGQVDCLENELTKTVAVCVKFSLEFLDSTTMFVQYATMKRKKCCMFLCFRMRMVNF